MNAKSTFRSRLIACVFAVASVSGAAMTQSSTDPTMPGHPRVNEVNQRLDMQQSRAPVGVADGQVNAKQESRDKKRDANIAQRESVDEAKHNGHLTRRGQKNLNKCESKKRKRIHKQRQG